MQMSKQFSEMLHKLQSSIAKHLVISVGY